MPSVSATRKTTRVFGVVKGVDGARVLRSGRRVLTESVEKKLKGAYDRDACYTAKTKNSPKNHGNKENAWTNGAKLKKQEAPRIGSTVADKKVPKTDPKIELKTFKDESLDGDRGTNKRFGIVYSRKRKRVVGGEKDETLEGKRYRLQSSQRQKSNLSSPSIVAYSTPELGVVVRDGSCRNMFRFGFACVLNLVLRHIKRVNLEVSKLAAFLVSEPFSSVFASNGIRFVQDPHFDTAGICKFYASQQFVPMFSVDFSAIPLCFLDMHQSLWFRFRCLESANNSSSEAEWDEMVRSIEAGDSCILMKTEITDLKTVPEVDNSGSTVAMHPSVTVPKLAARNAPCKSGSNSYGIRKKRSSFRRRKARNTSLVVLHKANDALVSDLLSGRKNGIPFSSVVSKNKLRSSSRCRYASNVEGMKSTVLAVSRHMELSKNKVKSSVESRTPAIVQEATAAAGVTQDISVSSCSANILVIDMDRCYRIKDATILLEASDSGEWLLVMKKDGSARYTHMAQKVIKPCSSNRITHDILWSVDENLKLEFPNRQDWFTFKDLYKECYDRNVPASASKAIPVPGVREVFGYEDWYGVPFSRPIGYICLNNDELDRALARTGNYDMDSEDEDWLKKLNDGFSVETNHLSEDKFELMIDSFESASYHLGECVDEEAILNKGLELGKKDLVEAVYGYWMQKRKQKRAPLLRVFQANQAKKVQLTPKPVLRKRRSLKRQTIQSGRGKQPRALQAIAAERGTAEEQNVLRKVEAAKASAKKAVELAIAKRCRAQLLMENADLAVYKAAMVLEISEAAHSSIDSAAAVPVVTEGSKDFL